MKLFERLFSSLSQEVGKLKERDKRFVLACVALSGFAIQSAEEHLLPPFEVALGSSVGPPKKAKVLAEFALGFLACCEFPKGNTAIEFFGREPDFAREMIGMLVLSRSDDVRQTLDSTHYSRNPDETRVQVLLAALRILGLSYGSQNQALARSDFDSRWKVTVESFIPGAILGFSRIPRDVYVERAMRDVRSLSARGEAIAREFIRRVQKTAASPNESSRSGSGSELVRIALPTDQFVRLLMGGIVRLTDEQLSALAFAKDDQKRLIDVCMKAMQPWLGKDINEIPDFLELTAPVSDWLMILNFLQAWKAAEAYIEEDLEVL